MIRFIYADQLSQYPVLADSMFRDRAAQFKDRLDWEVTVDENGWEVDQYDKLNPLYIIWENAEGRHGGSVRIMPTVGRIMTNEHFLDLTGGVKPGLLTTVDNHIGARTTIHYRPSTEDFLRDEAHPATRWRQSRAWPRPSAKSASAISAWSAKWC